MRVEFKGEEKGYCNICKKNSQLTRDHIPPKGCVKATHVELMTLKNYASLPTKAVISQSGLNIRSICGDCNNNLLGTKYDPELIKLTGKVANILRVNQEQRLLLPETITLTVKPQRLLRSVVGHILAGYLPIPETPPISAPFSDALRNYFLNQSSTISDKIEVYYWLYPSNKQIVINSLGIGSITEECLIASSCLLKFFPLAFWIVWDKPDSFLVNSKKISKDKFKGLDESCELVLELQNILPLDYPEIPDEGRFIIGREDASFLAQPKKPKGFGS